VAFVHLGGYVMAVDRQRLQLAVAKIQRQVRGGIAEAECQNL
jgi:hypothetical protein